MSTLVNCLKRLENEIYGCYGSQDNVLIEWGGLLTDNFGWQGNCPNRASVIRYYTIFNTDEINAIALKQLGLSVEEIYLCATAFLGQLWSSPAVRCPVRSNIEKLPAETLARFVNWCAIDATQMRELMKRETSLDDTFAYSYNSLRKWPLIATKAMRETLFYVGSQRFSFGGTQTAYTTTSKTTKRFSNALGASFQSYIGQLAHPRHSGYKSCMSESTVPRKPERGPLTGSCPTGVTRFSLSASPSGCDGARRPRSPTYVS